MSWDLNKGSMPYIIILLLYHLVQEHAFLVNERENKKVEKHS